MKRALSLLFFGITVNLVCLVSSAKELKVGVLQPDIRPGQLNRTLDQHVEGTRILTNRGARVIIAPEGIYPGYPSNDMLDRPDYIKRSNLAVRGFLDKTKELDVYSVFGYVDFTPKNGRLALTNYVGVAHKGEIIYKQAKVLLPSYGPFDDTRYFAAGETKDIDFFEVDGFKIAFLICEDSWFYSEVNGRRLYKSNPIARIKKLNPDLVVIINASPFSIGKQQTRLSDPVANVIKRIGKPVISVNQVAGIDQLVFDGASFGVNADGKMAFKLRDFKPDLAVVNVNINPMSPMRVELEPTRDTQTDPTRGPEFQSDLELSLEATSFHMREFLAQIGHDSVTFGLSGGIDSAMATYHSVKALGPENVFPILMPYTPISSAGSIDDSLQLCKNLGIPEQNILRIPIDHVVDSYYKTFQELGLDREFLGNVKFASVAMENIQARTRMAFEYFISNLSGKVAPEFKPLVDHLSAKDPKWRNFFAKRRAKLFTGDKSEGLIGNSTLYGDASGVFGVNVDKYKTWLYKEAYYVNKKIGHEIIPRSILEKEPNPELLSQQKTTDRFPSYWILDPILKDLYDNRMDPEDLHKKYDHLDKDPRIVKPQYQINGSLIEFVLSIYAGSEFKRQLLKIPGTRISSRAIGMEDRATIVGKKFEAVDVVSCETRLANTPSYFTQGY